MKKMILTIAIILTLMISVNSVKADSDKKKVQTNFQYKLVCDYYNGSDELTWGSQEYIGDFKNYDGTESNSNRACGATAVTKKFTLGDPNNNNLPREAVITYDNCNGSTGNQKAKVGQSCSSQGKVRTCTVKWTGYCYKDPNAKTTSSNKKSKTTIKRFTLSDTSLKVGETTKIKTHGSCYDYSVEDESILDYNSSDDSFKALAAGKTYINCYDKDGTYLARRAVRVKSVPVASNENVAKTEYRYLNADTNLYKTANGTGSSRRKLKKGKKVQYLTVKVNGYCKIKTGVTTGYVKCDNLNVEQV